MAPPHPRQVVLVTGCSAGGIGWHLCAALAARGVNVYASDRRPASADGLLALRCRVLQLDVTDDASVRAAVAEVLREAGRIDGRPGAEGKGDRAVNARCNLSPDPVPERPAPPRYPPRRPPFTQVLVNNAGIAIRKPLVDFSMDEARRLMDTNYFGCVAMCDAVVPGMMERGQGRIFNVGSGLGA